MKIRRPVFSIMNRYGGFLFFAALLALYVLRYRAASESIAPKGPGIYRLKLLSKEKTYTKGQARYRLGFQWEENKDIRLFAQTQDPLLESIWPGTSLIVKGYWQALPQKHSLQSFDYGQFLFHQGYKGLLKLERVAFPKGVAQNNASPPYREKLLSRIDSWPWKEPQKAIFKALFLGYKGELTSEIKKDFSDVGAMHFLAVSGLHVGILFLLLNYMLSLSRFHLPRALKLSIILCVLWSYAFLCGASPSVLRAVSMFSFLALANISRRPQNSLRALILSALIWLWIDPLLIHSLGFQLSYLAVLGILLFLPKLEAWYRAPHPLAHRLVQINYLSFSAQSFTWPLSIYYFGQFPLYFWLSSLLLMPLIALIMYGGILALVLSGFPGLAENYLAYYQKLFDALLYCISWIQKLPWATLSNLKLSGLYTGFFLVLPFAVLVKKAWRCPYLGLLLLSLGIYRISFRWIEPCIELKDHGPYPSLKELRMEEQRYFFYELETAKMEKQLPYLNQIDAQCILLSMRERYADSLIIWDQHLKLAPKKAP